MPYGPEVPAPASTGRFVANEIILYGLRLNEGRTFGEIELTEASGWKKPTELLSLRLEVYHLPLAPAAPPAPLDDSEVVIAAIYGYAFEGQCYRLDKQRVMAFAFDGADVPAVGCGFDETPPLNPQSYRMWSVTTKTAMIELTVNVDLAETLILEANLPGKRAPNTYGSKYQMAHRGGRLTNV